MPPKFGIWFIRSWTVLLLGLGCSLVATSLLAHGGGTPRLTDEVAGPYRVFAWTQPEPLRVGDIHLSIGVVKAQTAATQNSGLDEPVTDATVMVRLVPVGAAEPVIVVPTEAQAQLGNYYYEADARLPTTGEWDFMIDITGELGTGTARFTGEALAARELNWPLLVVAGLLLVVLLALIGWWNRMQHRTVSESR